KDYDDDINQINKEIVDIKSAISELQAKVGNGKFVTNIVKEGTGIKITWNDGTSSVIETIKGDKGDAGTNGTNGTNGVDGKDGKDGTIVSIIDGYWAFDGVKSDIPATGEKGDKGDAGEPGAPGAPGKDGADGHDAQISADGYWMVWDAATGEYVKTNYIAGGVNVVEVPGGWNLTVRDNNGDDQTIFLPTSAVMGYMDILNSNKNFNALYGINAKDVTYGPQSKTLAKGLYTTLGTDIQMVVNPQGTDASVYSYSLLNSDNQNTQLVFGEARPYTGPALSRATSENGIWVLPHDFTRYEDINDARTKNYLLFKANDAGQYRLALTATLNNTTIKTPYDVTAALRKIGDVTVYMNNITSCKVNTLYDAADYVSFTSPSVDAAAVYDYWITLSQTAANLKAAALYGVEISADGHSFQYTKNQGVNNSIKFVYNYITIDGTIVQGENNKAPLKNAPTFYAYMTEEMSSASQITLDRLETPMDAVVVLDSKKNYTYEYVLTTEAYDLTDLTKNMTDIEKLVWNSAIASNAYKVSLIGGEQDGNNWNTWNENSSRAYNVTPIFDTTKNTVTFQFYVSKDYTANFKLNKAYELTYEVYDEDALNTIATIILPFEFTQPTLNIERVNGDKAIWDNKKNILSLYGDLVNSNYMYAPMFEAWTTAYATEYSKFNDAARFYTLSNNGDGAFVNFNAKFLGASYDMLNNVPLTSIVYSAVASQWNTWAVSSYVNSEDHQFPIVANYNFYGVYPATAAQVPAFTLRFASLLADAKTVKANSTYTANNGSREVILTDADFTLVDAVGDNFYLFDGIQPDGNIEKRSNMNLRQGFEEGTEGFPTKYEFANAQATAYYYLNGTKKSLTVNVGKTMGVNAKFVTNTSTLTRYWEAVGTPADNEVIITNLPAAQANKPNYPGIPGGVMIQLPQNIGTTEPVTVVFELVDVFGATKTLPVTVQVAK
ncbi:MAG: collagen-like protein, partial [Duncaniella sp.]|nr:collagen-like protein [Duncaniella sp.]